LKVVGGDGGDEGLLLLSWPQQSDLQLAKFWATREFQNGVRWEVESLA